MQLKLTITSVESLKSKAGKPFSVAYGMEASPATLRQVVRVFVPVGREKEYVPGAVVLVTVSAVDIRRGVLELEQPRQF